MLNNNKTGKEKIGNIGKKMVNAIYPSVVPDSNVSNLPAEQQEIPQTPQSMGNQETEILIKMLDFMKSSNSKDKKYKKIEEKRSKAYSKQKDKKFDKIIDAFNPKKLSTSNTSDNRKKSKGFGVLASVGLVGAGALMMSNGALASVKVPNYGEMFDKDFEEVDMNFSNIFDINFKNMEKNINDAIGKDPMEEYEQSIDAEVNSSMNLINSEGFLSKLFKNFGLSTKGSEGKDSDSLVSKIMNSLDIGGNLDDSLDLSSFNKTLSKWEGIFSGNTPGVSYGSSESGSGLGRISQKYESGGRGSETVGWDSVGGTSYGKYQIASKVGAMDDYINFLSKTNPEAAKKLREAGPSDAGKEGTFAQVWRSMAKSGELGDTEHQYIKTRVYGVALRGVKDKSAREMIESDEGLREMFWSTSVHHGPSGAADIINRVYTPGMSKEEFIQSVYSERGTKFESHTPDIQRSVKNRFISEQSDIMSLVGKPISNVSSGTRTGTTTGYKSSGFGERIDPFTGNISHHAGVDYPAPEGTPVNATSSGKVVSAGMTNGGYGNLVVIDHGNGIVTKYAHLSTVDVKSGDTVAAGQKLGGVGTTGRSTGNHLHYEIVKDGKQVDPAKNALSQISPVGLNTTNIAREPKLVPGSNSSIPSAAEKSNQPRADASGGMNIVQHNNSYNNTTVAISTPNVSNLPIIIQMQQGITR